MNACPEQAVSKKTRVLCVDDSQDLAEMLVRMVSLQPDLEPVGILDCADDVVAESARVGADIVIMDLTMPGRPPLEAIASLVAQGSPCRVIAFTGYDDSITQAKAFHAGAWAVVSKNGDPTKIIEAIRTVVAS